MPEGDSIHRIANAIGPKLVGRTIERATTQGLARAFAGHTVTAVSVHGKHLLIDLDDGTQLRAHLGMYGRFRTFDRAAGDAAIAAMSPGRATLVLTTADHVFAWIGARTIEVAGRRAPMRGTAVAQLGPDILHDPFDPAAAATRAAEVADPRRAIGEVLLDQRVIAGIGNVYKSEVCFACSVDPRTPLGALDHAVLTALYTVAAAQMRANLGPGPRRTRSTLRAEPGDTDRYHVYGRTNRPCTRCRAAVECFALGDPPRWTWRCPSCQPAPPDRPVQLPSR